MTGNSNEVYRCFILKLSLQFLSKIAFDLKLFKAGDDDDDILIQYYLRS